MPSATFYKCLGCDALLQRDDWVVFMDRRVTDAHWSAPQSSDVRSGYAHPDCHPVAYGLGFRCANEGTLADFEAIPRAS